MARKIETYIKLQVAAGQANPRMQSFTPTTTWHCTSSMLINNDHFIIMHQVINISLKNIMCSQACIQIVQKSNISRII